MKTQTKYEEIFLTELRMLPMPVLPQALKMLRLLKEGVMSVARHKSDVEKESTGLSGYSLDEAMKQGNEEYTENEGKFDSEKEEDWPYHTANIQDARSVGIIPIKDSSAN